MRPGPWKVGELASRTGLSVRTLHYYDAIGLLVPSHHTEAGHRLYMAVDVARLQQIKSLRWLGLSLQEVRECLERPETTVERVVHLHLAGLKEQIAAQQKLCAFLETIAAQLHSTQEVSVEELIQTIEVISMLEKYYTPEQMEELKERRSVVGEERIREVEAEWPRLMEEVRAEMEKGTDPESERVRQLARRWTSLVQELTDGNPGIQQSLQTMYEQEPTVHGMDTGPMKEMMEYISRGMAASGSTEV